MKLTSSSIDAMVRAHRRLEQDHEDTVIGALRYAGGIVRAEVLAKPGFTPRTGALQRATTARVIRTRGGKILILENKKPYAIPIDQGAGPHIIRAKNGKALRFKVGGNVIFRRVVNHPGNKPYYFLRDATQTAFEKLEPILLQRMTAVAARFSNSR